MLDKFEKGIPLLESELLDSGLSIKDINDLVTRGELRKYTPIEGVYYINNPISFLDFSSDTIILPNQVIEKIYMGYNFEYGFYYADSLLNKLGLSTQVPNVVSILSSKIDRDKQITVDGMIFNLYSFSSKFREEYNRDNLYKYIVCLIENEYKNYLDISLDDYIRKKDEWGVSDCSLTLSSSLYKM